MAPIIHWFRRDLRLDDNTALAAAAAEAGGAVLPVFILDDAIFGSPRYGSSNRTAWLLANLRALDAELRARGSRLVVRRGEPLRELLDLARATGAAAVHWNRDYTPYAVRRDTAVKAGLREAGLEARSFKDVVIFEMGEVLTPDGRPYTVYSPYARRWRALLAERGLPPLQPAPALVAPASWPLGLPVPELAALGRAPTDVPLPPAGERAGLERLAAFCDLGRELGLSSYVERRDVMAVPGTSRLSPYLRLGVVSVRAALRAAMDLLGRPGPEVAAARDSIERWAGEIAWHDFYTQVLYHFPHVLKGAFKREFDALAWENDPALFAAWQDGRTGYPVVDAAMRQLRQEGWMHNRARMVVASFLTKDLLVDWRWGERHFMHLLLDGDPAVNNGSWQWAAGTGTDAQPYFRIFNPANQGVKFDPEGAYVRRYIPELANVPSRFIHEPHLMAPAEQIRADVQVGRDYPRPIVDHKLRRALALEVYGRVKGGAAG
jgi:deoxyribodipyrimidine photo-lyase